MIEIGENFNVILWLFKVEAIDRRDGEQITGIAVVQGTPDGDIDTAIERIDKQYGALGYEVKAAEHLQEKTYAFNSVDVFNELGLKKVENVAKGAESVADAPEDKEKEENSQQEAVSAALAELEGDA